MTTNARGRWGSLARPVPVLVIAALAVLGAGCSALRGADQPDLTIELRTLNGSGVTGTVAFAGIEGGRTRVTIAVDAAGHADMPAHIHPGTCDNLTPQPRYPLENVRAGTSTTEIPATIGDLLASPVAVNLHASVNDLQTYTACADIHRD